MAEKVGAGAKVGQDGADKSVIIVSIRIHRACILLTRSRDFKGSLISFALSNRHLLCLIFIFIHLRARRHFQSVDDFSDNKESLNSFVRFRMCSWILCDGSVLSVFSASVTNSIDLLICS
jgi:hypothetical protein